MKDFFGRRVWVILLAVVSLVGLIILASGLQQFKFDPPHMLKLEDLFNFSALTNGEEIPPASWLRYVMPVLLVITLLLFLGPLRPMTGKDLLKMLLRYIMFTAIAMVVFGRLAQTSPLFNQDLQSQSTNESGLDAAPGEFSPPQVNSTWEFVIASLVVVIVAVLLYFVVNRIMDRWFKPQRELKEIAEIARSALNDLSEDKVSKNVIIRCYVRMNSVVKESRGITREMDMTPAEFAQHLEKAGLPHDGVHGLTHVFEKVRYGAQEIQPDEIKEATQCLTMILKASQT
ncbi:MAG: DUF4129 domain-containing protein [Chloroflexi bacterium]|nr:DUF4129 domain-containing protein [Chloroflexota bacterium]